MGRAATLDNAMTACPMFSLSEAEARQIIGSIWAQVREWKVAFQQFGLPAETIEQAASAFRHIDTISTTKLRQALP
jgi:serine/threonine-protein kinase HipA